MGISILTVKRVGISDIESEYVDVKFKLNYGEKINYGSIYFMENFTDWNINENFKLDYDQIGNFYTKNN